MQTRSTPSSLIVLERDVSCFIACIHSCDVGPAHLTLCEFVCDRLLGIAVSSWQLRYLVTIGARAELSAPFPKSA